MLVAVALLEARRGLVLVTQELLVRAREGHCRVVKHVDERLAATCQVMHAGLAASATAGTLPAFRV